MTLIFFFGGGGGEEVRWKTVRTYGKILATPLIDHVIWEPIQSIFPLVIVICDFILLKNISIRRSQAGQQQSVRLVHVDTTQLDLNHKFELSVVQPPNEHNADETAKYYQLKQPEHFAQHVEVIL